MINRPTSVF